MKTVAFRDDEFRKSSRCGWSNSCVEVAIRSNAVAVRNTKDPSKAIVVFTPKEWAAFIAGVKNDEFGLVT